MLLLKLINQIPFFAGFSPENRQLLAEEGTCFTRFQAGDCFIREGTADDTLYIIVKGSAIVTKNAQPDHVLVELTEGAVIGEIAFLTGRLRTSNIIASTDVICFAVDKASMEAMEFSIQLQFKDELIKILIHHLDMANAALANNRAG